MNLFFASDLHGSLPATERVIAEFEKSGIETLVPVSYTHLTLPTNREV